jgi:hypothetical protein
MFFCVKLIVEPYYFGHMVEGKFQISKFLFIWASALHNLTKQGF